MNILRKMSKFKINQAYKTKKIFFHIFMFYSNLTSLQNWIMLENYLAYIEKPTNKRTENHARKAIWNDFPQESIKKAVLVFRKRLQACIRAAGGHFEHLLS